MHVVAEEDAPELFENQDQAEGEQHLIEVVALVQTAEQRNLQQHADNERDADAEREGEPKAARNAGEPVSEIGADHVKTAVRKIDHAHDAENKRQTARQQEQQQAVLNAVQELDQVKHLE